MSVFLGLDTSTQSLSAVAIDVARREVLLDVSVNYDACLPRFKSHDGVLAARNPAVKQANPLMWAAALDLLLQEVAGHIDPGRVRAIAGSGQQHGSVYLNREATAVLRALNPRRRLDTQLRKALSRRTSPIWMDFSTTKQCREIEDALGGPAAVAELTGSRCFERFTGPQIRKFWQREPKRYAATARIHLVSSFMASILAGKHAPIDHGDGAGMNLMDIRRRNWSPAALTATAPRLRSKLPPLARSDHVVGRISRYFVEKYGFSPQTRIVAHSGDNPCSLIGVGLIEAGRVCISLGTSDTYFGFMPKPRISEQGDGHVFGSPTGDYMSLICFQNGSLAREKVRRRHRLSWTRFSEMLNKTPPGNAGRVLLPYFSTEITPHIAQPGAIRYGLDAGDAAGNVRGVIEAQMASMVLHSKWMGVRTRAIYATGGASANRAILQTMADMHGADVYQFEVGNSAALGAALRGAHASLKAEGRGPRWKEIVAGFAEPQSGSRVRPRRETRAVYREFVKLYAACEAHALSNGKAPDSRRRRFAQTFTD